MKPSCLESKVDSSNILEISKPNTIIYLVSFQCQAITGICRTTL